jgi:transposase
MDYFAGLMCRWKRRTYVDRDGLVIHEAKVQSTPADIKAALARAPVGKLCSKPGRMAQMLHHGLTACGVPVICIESRQARQALKSFTTHKTDRNDACGQCVDRLRFQPSRSAPS